MVENDPIDDLLKNKMQERSFSPGPNDWREMEALLEQHMPVKTKKRWLWIPVFFCVASTIVIYWPSAKAPVVAPDNAIIVQKNSSQSSGLTETAVTKNTDRGITEQNLSASTLTKPAPNAAYTISSNAPAPLSPGKADATNNNSTNDKTTSAKKTAPTTPVTPYRKRSTAPKKEDIRNNIVSQNHTATTTLPATAAPALFTTTKKETENPLPDTATAREKNEDPIMDNKITDNTNTPAVNPIEQVATTPATDTSAALKDSTSNQTAGSVQDSLANTTKNGTDKKFSLALSVGIQGWQTENLSPDTLGTKSTDPFFRAYCIGVQGSYRLNPKWSVSAGLQYALYTHQHYVKDLMVKDYSFGSILYHTRISTQLLNYLQVPAEVQYHITNKHTLLAAVHTNMLINAKQTIDQWVYKADTFPERLAYYGRSAGSGYTSGFRLFSVSLALGYGINLNNHWLVLAKAQYGLTSSTTNRYSGNAYLNRNMAFQFIVRYNIIRY